MQPTSATHEYLCPWRPQSSCPDPLASLSGACIDMPNMPQCAQFERWCDVSVCACLCMNCKASMHALVHGLV